MAERFTAWAMCPKCERVDCHGLRAPKPFDPNDPIHRALEQIAVMASVWGSRKPIPSDEARFEVIRQCKCGHEWGQV